MPKLKLFNSREALSIHEVAAAMVMVTTCYLRIKKPLPPAPHRTNPFSSPRHVLKLKSGTKCRVFNLKVDRQLSHEYFTSDAIYNGSAAMTLYY